MNTEQQPVTSEPATKKKHHVMRRIVLCGLILSFGVAVMLLLTGMKKPPAVAEFQERVLRVEVVTAEPQDVTVVMTGYGTVQPRQVVQLAPEVSGRVAAVHDRLEIGAVIPAGEVLLVIDPHDYEIAAAEAQAQLEQLEHVARRLEKQLTFDRQRLTTLERNRELAQSEYERVRRLFEQNQVGTRAGVEAAEKAYNAMQDSTDQLAQAIALYPLHLAETRSRIQIARSHLAMAETNLARCQIMAPFDARIVSYTVEKEQLVNRGMPVITLADDSQLEIQVPLDSRDARKWLRFADTQPVLGSAWFRTLEPVICSISWTEDPEGATWLGRLHRVVHFNEDTRTLTVAVRLNAKQALANNHQLPLVDGMFCRIDIPGLVLSRVIPLPRWAVSFDNTVYRAYNGRLQTVDVEVARIEGETAYIRAGLNAGDQVIRTRLVDPLENSLLEIMPAS